MNCYQFTSKTLQASVCTHAQALKTWVKAPISSLMLPQSLLQVRRPALAKEQSPANTVLNHLVIKMTTLCTYYRRMELMVIPQPLMLS
jgi:hypothetical protein